MVFTKSFFSKAHPLNLLIHFRICHYLVYLEKKNVLLLLLYYIILFRYKRLQIYCGIEISQLTHIGYGLRLPHRGAIVVHPQVIMGNNCEIMTCVTIGNNILKNRDAVATIGDNVLIATGVKIIGKVTIGNNVIIGSNAVVNKNVPDNVIVAGVPARIIKENKDLKYLINIGED